MNRKLSKDELEKRISELPVGYISKKNIRGTTCYYRQWKENGKVKSEYINPNDVDYIVSLIDERRKLQLELRMESCRLDSSAASQKRLYEYAKRFYLSQTVGIGHQDYEVMICDKLFYIDKTYFIQDWWNHNDQVTLITRPRRFGKTLNLSMINCFFSRKYEGRSDLFEGLDVWKNTAMHELQGSQSVIFLSFGDIKASNAHGQIEQIKLLVSSTFLENDYICKYLDEDSAQIFRSYYTNITEEMAIRGIRVLCELMYKAFGEKVIILLDEYDTPMLEAWTAGAWEECSSFMRLFFNSTLKTNPYLYRAMLTGITRISKESFFSDMNNLRVCSMTSPEYDYAFGFTEKEVFDAMDAQKLTNKDAVRDWYNGFSIGRRTDIYNPGSIVNFLREKELQPYWVHSSSNKMINDFFKRGDKSLKYDLEDLINGKHIFTHMNEETPFGQIYEDNSALWSLLFASGYMKIVSTSGNSWDKEYELTVTNKEVYYMLLEFIKGWFSTTNNGYSDFITAMLSNDVEYMNVYLSRICSHVFSYYDISGDEPERFYHGFVLGMLVDLEDRFIITSNRESGLGRYDVVLEPRNCENNPAIIMEFKVHRPRTEADLISTAQNALRQIEEKDYEAQLISNGILPDNIFKYGIAFKGKEVWIEK